MPFAPHEIENKRFVVALRGYQTDEVDAFLRAVAADYRDALARANSDAEEIRRAAEEDAAAIRSAANAEAESVYDGIARQAEELRRLEADLRDRLTALDHAVREGKQAFTGLSPLVP